MAPNMNGVLTVDISKTFGSGFELQVNFAAPSGITIIFGESGSGKTTLLNCIAGLLAPDRGHITVGDQVLFDDQHEINIDISRRNVGYVFQTLALFPHLSVADNVGYGIAHFPADSRRERVRSILHGFRVEHLAQRRPADISGGERQRVALARSLVTEPRVMLLDEPLSALDLATQSRLIDDLRAWTDARRIPILYVTHSQREVRALGERVLVLEKGRIVAQGTPRDVLDAPREESIAQLVGIENVFEASVTSVHEDLGTMSCKLAGTNLELEVPLGNYERGSSVMIGVRAGDILLATVAPEHLSARNVIHGTISSLRQEGVTVHAKVDCGIDFHVKLTPGSLRNLQLWEGKAVWLVIKTYSCQLLRPVANKSRG